MTGRGAGHESVPNLVGGGRCLVDSVAAPEVRPRDWASQHQGNQYRVGLYRTVLARCGVDLSMSRKANCYDNAPVESFFSSLKNELVRHRQFQNQADARYAIAELSSASITASGLHQVLGYRSQEEFERQESA
jgi:transposase InsO family protein